MVKYKPVGENYKKELCNVGLLQYDRTNGEEWLEEETAGNPAVSVWSGGSVPRQFFFCKMWCLIPMLNTN